MRRAFLLSMVLALSAVVAIPSAGANRGAAGKGPRGKTYVINAVAGLAAPITWEWDPADITINVGDRIKWENPTDTAHSVLPWEKGPGPQPIPWGNEQTLEPGNSATFRFTKGGVYLFRCGVPNHSGIWWFGDDEGTCIGMCGTVNVAA